MNRQEAIKFLCQTQNQVYSGVGSSITEYRNFVIAMEGVGVLHGELPCNFLAKSNAKSQEEFDIIDESVS